jgi:hypothetical protein
VASALPRFCGIGSSGIPGRSGVRVWQITSGGRRPPAGRPPPQRANVDYPPFVPFTLSARFRDTGDTQRVVILLKELNLQSGTENTLLTFDSNTFSSSTNYQAETAPRPCQFALDFGQNAYYVAPQNWDSSGSGASPGPEAIWVNRCAGL